MLTRVTRFAAISSIGLLASCGVVSEDKEVKQEDIVNVDIDIAACADVNDADANNQVANANQLLQANLKGMSESGNWNDMQAFAPAAALQSYNAVLAKYPSHCGAQFGKAISILANMVNNPDLDEVMDSLNAMNSEEDYSDTESSYDEYLGASAEQREILLLKTTLAAANASPMTITRMQQVGERLMPTVDSAIAMLENVMSQKDFSTDFYITRDDRSTKHVQIDKGEVGPGLALLKYIKAMLISFISVQAEIALNGNYDWIEVLDTLNREDMDHLTATQTAALDQALSLTKSNSPFLTIKSEYRSSFAAIPTLLESALNDLQAGLQYGIEEAAKGPEGQEFDVYTVGTWEDADVNPADLKQGIESLERIRKYLKGPVNITWAHGKYSLTIDVPKFFQITDGYQDFLPYHKVLPYNEWNDTLAMDTTWENWCSVYTDCGEALMTAIGKKELGPAVKVNSYFPKDLYNLDEDSTIRKALNATYSTVYMANYSNGKSIYFLNPSTAKSCTMEYLVSGETVAKPIQIPSCKIDSVGGELVFATYVDPTYKSPFVFTDANGRPTFGSDISKDIEDIYDTKGLTGFANKIIFPDPTFGGVFPNLTQENIWTTINAFKEIKPRKRCNFGDTIMDLEEVNRQLDSLAEIDENYSYHDEIEDCDELDGDKVLPSNPSDLDVLYFYFD